MIVTMIVVAEVGFWVLLVGGLCLRYPLRRPRAGAALLLCEPLLELTLLAATVVDLRGGATASARHGLAAVYVGFSVGYGHYTVAWADRHFAYRFAGGPRPAKPPKYGMARAVHEWRMWLRTALGAGVAAGLLQLAIWYVDDPDRTAALRDTQTPMGILTGIWLLVALSYTLWPKDDPAGRTPATGRAPAAGPTYRADPAPTDTDPARPAVPPAAVGTDTAPAERPGWLPTPPRHTPPRHTHRDR
ncbi:hypothetical protein [Streptomyces sp. NPDC057702]|uniref:hypothetical protein n=1 Tax=unclassified Streptomyces TaxID=2593676 RepID=UPI0036818F7C